MATKRIYISCPISVDEEVLETFSDIIDDETNFLSAYWIRSTKYNNQLLLKADGVLFILPRVQFDCNISSLPTGVKTELDLAIKNNKPIFIGYITINGEARIYNARIVGNTIGGVGCTSGKIFNHDFDLTLSKTSGHIQEERVVAVLDPVMDKRLLLML
jgi:hypothetical protein